MYDICDAKTLCKLNNTFTAALVMHALSTQPAKHLIPVISYISVILVIMLPNI